MGVFNPGKSSRWTTQAIRDYRRNNKKVPTIGLNVTISDKDWNKVLRKLNNLPREAVNERNKILRKAAKPVRDAARNNVKDAEKPVFRYNTPKLIGKIRAPRNEGKKIAKYVPGNLRKSIKYFKMRRSKWAIYVGAKPVRYNGSMLGGTQTFGRTAKKVDGYYWHLIEKGAPASGIEPQWPVRRAYMANKGNVKSIFNREWSRFFKKWGKKNGVNSR